MVEGLPRCDRLPHINSVAAPRGCAYVLEGATLGGRFLYARFHTLSGLTEDSGARFLHAYGKPTAPMWHEFTTAPNAMQLDRYDEAECVAAARSTFATLTQCLLARPDTTPHAEHTGAAHTALAPTCSETVGSSDAFNKTRDHG
jgi:heme oxygenase (biliverdin-IX-beta and delta-forming)